MRNYLLILIFYTSLLNNCTKNPAEKSVDSNSSGIGLRFYYAENISDIVYPNRLNADSLNLYDKPLIFYENIIFYDTSVHKFYLNIETDSFFDYSSLYKPFVLTLDSIAIYSGWVISGGNSIIPNDVYIETIDFNDGDSAISILFGIPGGTQPIDDPRLDSVIIERLLIDNKII